MSQPIDVSYVELRALGEDDAARDIKRAVDDMERDVDRASRSMEADLSGAFASAADDIERALERSGSILTKEATRQRHAWRSIGDEAVEAFDDVTDAIDEATDALGGGGGGGGGGSLVSSLAHMGSQLRNISVLAPSPLVAGLIAAVPAIIALGGALADLSAIMLALPAAISVLIAGFATLKVAFSGMGEAVEALASGDLEKINEAMKKLAPAAQEVAREVNRLREPFAALRREVQQSFFAPLVGDLTRVSNAVMPSLRKGMTDVAAALGEFGSGLADVLSRGDNAFTLGQIFDSTARIIRDISPDVLGFIDQLFSMIKEALPFVERAFSALGDGLKSVNQFLGDTTESGEFDKFLEDAFATMKDLFDLTKEVFGLLKSVFGDAGDEGRTFIQSLTDMTAKMTAFFESADGQEIIQRLLDTLPALVSTLEAGGAIIGFLLVGWNGWMKALEDVGGAVVAAGKAIGDFFQAAWDWVQRAGSAVGGFFTSLGEWFKGVGKSISDAWESVKNFGGQVLTFLEELPGKILGFLQDLPGMLGNLFTTALNQAAYWVGFGIGTIVAYFRDLPQNLWEKLQLLISFVTNAFTTVRDRGIALVLQLVDKVVEFVTGLPERIANGLTALVDKVRSFFTRTRDEGQSRIRDLINGVQDFFSKLPERVGNALNNFRNRVVSIFTSIKDRAYNIGRDIINGIKNGITDAIQGAVRLARDAAGRIVKGFKDALSTGSPSKVTRDEVGRPIAQGIGVGIEAEQSGLRTKINQLIGNVVPTLSVPATGVAGSGSSGTVVNFDTGAVQVVFEGVVPTEDEARRTGTAVGQGIAQTLARRNVRTLVRTT